MWGLALESSKDSKTFLGKEYITSIRYPFPGYKQIVDMYKEDNLFMGNIYCVTGVPSSRFAKAFGQES